MSKRSILQNIGSSIVTQIASIALALLLPPLLIRFYGSESNGFLTSVSQYVRYFSLIEGGVVAAASVALFQPLAQGDANRVNQVFSAVSQFFRKVGWICLLLSLCFSFWIPASLHAEVPYFHGVLIATFSCSVPTLGYLVFFKYHLVLTADQKAYIVVYSLAASSFVSAILQILLISCKADLVYVAIVPATVSIARMLMLRTFVRRKYPFLQLTDPDSSALNQKWDSLAINMSRLVKTVIPLAFINVFYDFEYASIFNIYILIFSIGSSVLELAGNNLTASLGVRVTESKRNIVRETTLFDTVNSFVFYLVGLISACFFVLFVPFVKIYVGSNTGVDYVIPGLAFCFLLNEAINNIRFAPNLFVRARGHYRQTRSSAFVELFLALLFTPLGLISFGFPGVLLGSLIASLYRTLYIFWYCNSRMFERRLTSTAGLAVRATVSSLFCGALLYLITSEPGSIASWVVSAVVVLAVGASIMAFLYLLLERKILKGLRWPRRE